MSTPKSCFYARAIHFFRTHPHALLRRDAWDGFRKDFALTVHRIKRLSSTVETEADLARMQQDKLAYKEVLDLVEGLKDSKLQKDEAMHCYHIPLELSPRFWGREEALRAAREALCSGEQGRSLKTFAIYGIGGVGKTQIALQYAKQSRDIYNVILWVAANNSINVGQSFREIACSLGLVENDDEIQDAVKAILKVKNGFLKLVSFHNCFVPCFSASQALGEGEGQLARAEYKLAVLFEEKGMHVESAHCKGEALRLWRKLQPQDENGPFEESSFMKLCLWMLW